MMYCVEHKYFGMQVFLFSVLSLEKPSFHRLLFCFSRAVPHSSSSDRNYFIPHSIHQRLLICLFCCPVNCLTCAPSLLSQRRPVSPEGIQCCFRKTLAGSDQVNPVTSTTGDRDRLSSASSFRISSRLRTGEQCDPWIGWGPWELLLWIWESARSESTLIQVMKNSTQSNWFNFYGDQI